jgi:hypothetical protein
MKTYGGVGIELHCLPSVLDEGEWSASRSARFTTRENNSGINWIGDWLGPRAGVDAVENIFTFLHMFMFHEYFHSVI